MAFTAPKTWASEKLTSSDLNTFIRDNQNHLKVNIALEAAVELTISGGVVTKTKGYHSIDTQGGAGSDDLDTINGGSEGDVLLLRAENAARTVVLKDGTGNLQLGSDITLDDIDLIAPLLYDGSNWIPLFVGATQAYVDAKFSNVSRARAYKNTIEQVVPTGAWTRVELDVESFDYKNEFTTTRKTGVADATEANKLHDADGGFAASDVGAAIWNTTDNTYTTVSAFVDSGELTLADDIMVNGENYILFHSIFKASEAGYYYVIGAARFTSFADGARCYIGLFVNESTNACEIGSHGSHAGHLSAMAPAILSLNANDTVVLKIWQNTGGNLDLHNVGNETFMAIHRLS